MAYEQKDGQGSLFKNEDRASDRHPEYRGSITIAGRVYWLSAWVKSTKDGKKYFSLAAQPKVEKGQQAGASQAPRAAPPVEPDFDDPLPF